MASFPEGKSGAKRRSGAAEDSFIALFVGRPERRKGIHRLLDVWQRRMGSNDVLWLAGVSPDRARSISPDHGDNIKAFGYVENLRPLYAAADVVVLPSEHEGFGYALLEGAAMECSLLASRIPGPDALVVDGRNGFLIAVGDDDGLTACLGRLRDDRTLCRWLGQNARLSALRFDRGLILDQYAEYLLQFGKSGIPAESGHL